MRRTVRRLPEAGATLFLAAILVACGGPSPSAATAAGPAAKGPLDPALAANLAHVSSGTSDQLGAAAAALGATDRAEVDAAKVLGPAVADLQALQDATELKDAQVLEADAAKAAAPGPGIRLASVRSSGAAPDRGPASALVSVAWGIFAGITASSVSSYDPRSESPPATSQFNSQGSSGGATSSVSGSVTTGSSGGVVTVVVSMTSDTTGAAAGPGGAPQVTGSSSLSVSINPCPDPAGRVSGHIDIADDETDSGGSGASAVSVGYRYQGTADFVTTVDDQAQISTTQVTAQMDRSVTSTDGTVAVDAAVSASYDANGGYTAPPSMTVTDAEGPATQGDVQQTGHAINLFESGTAVAIGLAARTTWQSGRCFQVRPTPNGGEVGPSSKTPVKVTVYHWVDKADIDVPVKATLAGTKSVDPSGSNQTSPATFQYTAGTPGSTGDVTFKSVSRRGISETTAQFKVKAGLLVDISGTYTETIQGLFNYNLRVTAHGISVSVTDAGTVTASGNVTVTGTVSSLECHGRVNEAIPVSGTGTITGPEDAPILRVLIGPASLSKLGETLTCVGGISLQRNDGDFFGQWSEAIGPVDLPAAGGTVTKSGSNSAGPAVRHAAGTFTATPK